MRSGENTTKAAELLHMSQPAVSLAIREMEDYYGVALFDRIGRRLSITEAGKRFREYASHISTMFDDMEKTLRDWGHLGVLRVGASITVGSAFCPATSRPSSRCIRGWKYGRRWPPPRPSAKRSWKTSWTSLWWRACPATRHW